MYERLKAQSEKVSTFIEKTVSFVTCCAEAHKGNFNSDLEVIKRSLLVLVGLTPTVPIDEIQQATEALIKTCEHLSYPYLKRGVVQVPNPDAPAITPRAVANFQKQLNTAVESNLLLLKGMADQQQTQQIQSSLDASKKVSAELGTLLQKVDGNASTVDITRMSHLNDDLVTHCSDIVTVAQKLFKDIQFG